MILQSLGLSVLSQLRAGMKAYMLCVVVSIVDRDCDGFICHLGRSPICINSSLILNPNMMEDIII
jgi:hypothetical protein